MSASIDIVYCKLININLQKYPPGNNETITRLLNGLKMQMHQKFGEVEKNVLLTEATILDPCLKKAGSVTHTISRELHLLLN